MVPLWGHLLWITLSNVPGVFEKTFLHLSLRVFLPSEMPECRSRLSDCEHAHLERFKRLIMGAIML